MLGQAGVGRGVELAGAAPEDHRHALGRQLVGDEEQDREARPVEPVCVVDHDAQGCTIRGGGQQAQHRVADRQRRGLVVLQPEGTAQRPGLRRGELVDAVEQRPGHAGEPGEHHVAEHLAAGRARHGEPPRSGVVADLLQHPRLSLAGRAGDGQAGRGAGTGAVQGGGEPIEDVVAPTQGRRGRSTGRGGGGVRRRDRHRQGGNGAHNALFSWPDAGPRRRVR